MVNIYFKKYKRLIDAGQMTVAEAIADAQAKVPEYWRAEVIAKLEELNR